MDKTNLRGHGLAEMPKSPRSSPNAVRIIDVLTFPAVQLLDVTGPVQVFASANDIVEGAGGARPYRLRLMAQGGGGVTATAGVGLAAEPLSRRGEALDTLIVAGGPGVEAAAANPALLDWLRQRATQARRVASVCTGAFLLAAAGILDGRRATTHWKFSASLAQRIAEICTFGRPIAKARSETVHGRVVDLHATQHHFERHRREGFGRHLARKQEIAVGIVVHCLLHDLKRPS